MLNFWGLTSRGFTGCETGVNLPGGVICPNISPAPAPLPNLQASAERTKNQLSNACLRSQNGGVGAEICLC